MRDAGKAEPCECPECGGQATRRYMSSHPFGADTGYYEYKASPCACGGVLQRFRKEWVPTKSVLGWKEFEDLDKWLAALSFCACGGPLELLESLARDTADRFGGFASIDLPVDQAVADYLAVKWTLENGYDYQLGIGGFGEEDKKHITREEAIALLSRLLALPAEETA